MGQSAHQARYLWGAVQEVVLPVRCGTSITGMDASAKALLLCRGWPTCLESSRDLYTNVHLALSPLASTVSLV